jgi:hypothetical protein|tara:strand:+ start:191 stop:409 length:219 start_codon:yes stop_codon:yes gene_type:complete
MTATFYDRVATAGRETSPLKVLLTVLAGLFWLVGAAVGLVLRVAFFVVRWVWAAAVVGFRDVMSGRSSDGSA